MKKALKLAKQVLSALLRPPASKKVVIVDINIWFF
jgi:hypothetical protein